LARDKIGILLIIVIIGALIRFYGINAKSLWYDESLSWRLQKLPVSEIIARTSEESTTHPPGYFIVLRFWAAI
jgi:hypothetical protein